MPLDAPEISMDTMTSPQGGPPTDVGSGPPPEDLAVCTAIRLLATGLRRVLARRHGLHEPAGSASGTCGGIEWMSENVAPMVTAPGGDAAPAMSRAGLHKQGGPAGATNTDRA